MWSERLKIMTKKETMNAIFFYPKHFNKSPDIHKMQKGSNIWYQSKTTVNMRAADCVILLDGTIIKMKKVDQRWIKMKIPRITIASLDQANNILPLNGKEGELGKIDYKYLISIGSDAPKCIHSFSGRVFRLEFDDITHADARYNLITHYQVQQIIDFCQEIINAPGDVFIHCAQGISRSSACALILLSMIFGKGKESEAVAYLENGEMCEHDPDIHPNELILSYADQLLNRENLLLYEYKKVFPNFIERYLKKNIAKIPKLDIVIEEIDDSPKMRKLEGQWATRTLEDGSWEVYKKE